MHKWFKYMTGRYVKYGITQRKKEEYEEVLSFFYSFINIVRHIEVDDMKWKPFQIGMLITTQTALDLLKIYLNDDTFSYVLLGRLTQDALENLFSQVRSSRQPVPDAREFKVALRLICFSQFEGCIHNGSYEQSDQNHLISYCDELNNILKIPVDVQDDAIVEEDYAMDFCNHLTHLAADEDILSCTGKVALYYLVGVVLHKVKQQYSVCDHCISALITNPENNHITLL
ncbi:hypothetical protein QE152_g19056 [Popillia japonica]|uniref:Uncharacterized protein n=1 Tax=Popillia japonica TaxID=7064 RepID=A0AAW1L3K4_POPJA